MSASTSDKLRKGYQTFSTTLATTKDSGASTMSLSSATGLPTTTALDFTVGRVDSSGTRTPSTKAVYKGTLSGTTVSNLTLIEGTDQSHAAGTVVEITFTASMWNDHIDHHLAEHNQDGTHGDVTTTSISNSGALTQTGAATITGALTLKSYDGWITETNTWTYVSGTGTVTGVFKISGVDATGYLEPGMRIKLTQSATVKYGIITKVSFSTDTTVTCLMAATSGTVDNSGIANATLSSPAFSRDKIPFGFPIDPAKWTVSFSDTSDRTASGSTTWTNTGNLGITLPIGAWAGFYSGNLQNGRAQANTGQFKATLSTANNSESDATLTATCGDMVTSGTTSQLGVHVHKPFYITVTSATPYYLNCWSAATSTRGFNGTAETTLIKAVCAYL